MANGVLDGRLGTSDKKTACAQRILDITIKIARMMQKFHVVLAKLQCMEQRCGRECF